MLMKELMIECENIAKEIKPLIKTKGDLYFYMGQTSGELMEKYTDNIVGQMIQNIYFLIKN